MFGLDELKAVLPPPADPRITAGQAEWIAIFDTIGTRLPGDFVETYKAYGDGAFVSRSHPRSANVWLYAGSREPFHRRTAKHLSLLRLTKERRAKLVPFPLYWEPSGLLPWGRASNELDLCWRVSGELVDNWPVVVLRAGTGENETFEMSAIQFLARVIAKSISCSLMPMGFPGEKGVEFQSFGPSTHTPNP
jgi:hypothetical protein